MSSFKSQVVIYIISFAVVIGFIWLVNWFFSEKIDFNTKEYGGKNIVKLSDIVKTHSPNLTNTKIIRSLVYGFIIIDNTSKSLIKKLKLHDGSQIDSSKVDRFYRDIQSADMNLVFKLRKFLCTYTVESDGSFNLTNNEKQFISQNENLAVQIAKYCSGYFETECFNFIVGNNIKTTSNTRVSPIGLFLARFCEMLNSD